MHARSSARVERKWSASAPQQKRRGPAKEKKGGGHSEILGKFHRNNELHKRHHHRFHKPIGLFATYYGSRSSLAIADTSGHWYVWSRQKTRNARHATLSSAAATEEQSTSSGRCVRVTVRGVFLQGSRARSGRNIQHVSLTHSPSYIPRPQGFPTFILLLRSSGPIVAGLLRSAVSLGIRRAHSVKAFRSQAPALTPRENLRCFSSALLELQQLAVNHRVSTEFRRGLGVLLLAATLRRSRV
ncbi:hypothetical protein MRX96_043247 [Rhipicephalus microplus]